MSIKKWIIQRLYNSKLPIHTRMFILTSIIVFIFTVLSSFIYIFTSDIVSGLIMLVSVLLYTVFVHFSFMYHFMEKAALTLCLLISLVSMPVAYFLLGGAKNGVMMGYIVASIYITVVLPRKRRRVVLILLAISLAACVAYEYITLSSADPSVSLKPYLFLYISTFIVCALVSLMIGLLIRLFLEETKRSKAQKEEIERLIASQNNFFSSMSHEIRTPINTIIGLNEMILREDVSQEVAENAANIRSASRLLLNVINDILDMSKFESGQMTLTEDIYYPADMLSDIVGLLWIRAKEKELEFNIKVAPELPTKLYGDEMRLKQILINILTNAIKYTGKGSVTLSIECGERSGNILHVIYSVKDTGMGIKKEDIPYLFNAFKRVDEKNVGHIEGTGLGLAIVKQFVELMNGVITVNSVYTKGSTFLIDIPQKIGSEETMGDFDINERHNLSGKEEYHRKFEAPEARILVVDDNASNLLVLKKLLRETKLQIDTASGGQEALSKTLNNEYNVILMDHVMPVMDGVECRKRIVSQTGGRCRASKIVALTANAGSDMQAFYAKEGFDGYIVKPVSGDILERELLRLLPKDLIISQGNEEDIVEETMQWMHSAEKRKNLIITTESVADIPLTIARKYGIMVLPHMVKTDEGIFKDGTEIETTGLLSYMEDPSKGVATLPPSVEEHEAFFAEALALANNVIHISISSRVQNSGCPAAMEAAGSFDNVTVIDSSHLSSGQGLLVIEAARLAEEGAGSEEIIQKINEMIKTINTAFVVDNLDFLARADQVSGGIAQVLRAFTVHPMLVMKKGRITLGKLFFGTTRNAWEKYISYSLKNRAGIDTETLFVTHVGITSHDMEFIKEEVEKRISFDEIIFQKASPAIAVNCGAGTFGLFYKLKDNG